MGYVIDLPAHQILVPGFDACDLAVFHELVFHRVPGTGLEPQTGKLGRGPLELTSGAGLMNVATELTGQPVERRGAVKPRPAVNAQPHQKLKHEHTETEHCGHGRHQHDCLDDGDSARRRPRWKRAVIVLAPRDRSRKPGGPGRPIHLTGRASEAGVRPALTPLRRPDRSRRFRP